MNQLILNAIKKKLKPLTKLKKELDKWFSLYIRLRDATKEGLVQCFTCGCVKYYKSGMHCGHFQSRSFLSTRFHEENCQVQCVACNLFKQGEQYKFSLSLDGKYGEGTSESLEILARQNSKFTRVDYDIKISYYKRLVKKLKKQKGID